MTARTYGTTSKGGLAESMMVLGSADNTKRSKTGKLRRIVGTQQHNCEILATGGYKKKLLLQQNVRKSNYENLRNAGAPAAVAESGDTTPTLSVGIAGRRRRLRLQFTYKHCLLDRKSSTYLGKIGPLGIGRSSKSRATLVED